MTIPDNIITSIRDHPHKLGHYLGYDKLTDIHSDWILKCWKSDHDYTIQAHRNSYKTTAVLVVGFIWYMLFNPDKTILFVRKEYEGAASIIREIAKHYVSAPILGIYKALYDIDNPLTMLRKDKIELVTKRKVTKEANLETIGIGGAITGRHYDKIFTDDIITIKDRVSKAEREKTKLFIQELVNIPIPGGTKTHTGTPWHPDDGFTLLPEADKYPIGAIQIHGMDSEYLKQIRDGMTASLYAANYELKHISDEDRLFPEPVYGDWPVECEPIALIDPAYSGKHTTSLVMLGEYNDEWYCRGWVWRKNIVDLYDTVVNLLQEYKCGTLHVEMNADKGLSVKDFKAKYAAVKGYHEKVNKHYKIISYAVKHFKEIKFAYDCQSDFLAQLLDYQEAMEPDDAADAFAAILREAGFSGIIIKPARAMRHTDKTASKVKNLPSW